MAKTPDPAGRGADVLGVYLEPVVSRSVRVGSLLREPAGTVTFIVDETYIDRGPARPILSLAFKALAGEDETVVRLRDRTGKTGTANALPGYFANLLPEGALRSVVEAQLPAGQDNEYGMLKRLGADLPGAVVIRREGDANPTLVVRDAGAPEIGVDDKEDDSLQIKFSLAGVQMKFSMIEAGDRLTLPARGETGRLVVKLPSKDYRNLPEIEFGAMTLAQAAGIDTAGIRLVPTTQLQRIDPRFLESGRQALAVTRFDRAGEERIHMEDFAQIVGAVGPQKYTKTNIETVVNLCARFTPDPHASVLEMIRRVVVDIMLGNGDSHLKNSSFLYRDGRTPTLSPAYDIVPTVFFKPQDDLALTFNGKKRFESIAMHEFERMAGYVGVTASVAAREVARTVERANDIWPGLLKDLPWPRQVTEALASRWPRLTLFGGMANPFAG